MIRKLFLVPALLFTAACVSNIPAPEAPNRDVSSQNGVRTIRLATSADTFPYNFGRAEGCRRGDGVCGFEIDLFEAICQEMGVRCTWQIQDWGSIFDNLLRPRPDGSFPYDAVVASAEASEDRRATMLFSARYYMAWHLFVGRRADRFRFDPRGFPVDEGRPLRIGTWDGFLMNELRLAYPTPKNVRLVPVASPIDALKNGDIDLAFVFTGTEVGIVKDPRFEMKGRLIEVLNTDPQAGIGAASRRSAQGAEIQRIFSEGLVRIRKKGLYQRISQFWLGRDIWDRQLGPKIP